MDLNFKEALKATCLSDDSAALVTIIDVKGSTPRKPGAKMLVLPNGQVSGTIGGGCGEAEVRREALNALTTLTPSKYIVNMTNALAGDEGMVCGGIMEVWIDILEPGLNNNKKLMLEYIEALENKESPTLITITASDDSPIRLGEKLFITSSDEITCELGSEKINEMVKKGVEKATATRKPLLIKEDSLHIFIEPSPTTIKMLILGGGHIALPLATMAKILGYHVTVIDDRPAFANPQRFPNADVLICNDFVPALKTVNSTPNTFIVIVTRGHRHDKLCLQEVINHPAAYIGMIGSHRRVKALMSELQMDGVPTEIISKIHTPIGLDIASETPEEVAVSILAEIINVYRGGKAPSLKLT